MKVAGTKGNIAYSEGLETTDMGVSVENLEETLDQVAGIFADGIYHNKILAPVRELITNAVDEHRKYPVLTYGKAVSVKIEREDGKLYWGVRDYALGLSEDDVRNVLGMLLKSTKNKSNKAMGGFGVGAKSFFAYTELAFISSYYKGKKSVYAAFKDGVQNRGKLGLVHEEPSEETGIEVRFEINPEDIDEFVSTTKTYINNSREDTLIEFNIEGHSYTRTHKDYNKKEFPLFNYV